MLTIDMASSKLSMDVSVNSILSYTATFTSNRYGPLQEVINPNVLLWGKNRLDFTFYNDDEAYSAILSDIVLWIEVDI
jgi:delta-aminolevulinic acid dehydratase/porphobilinogen synthase